LNNTKTRTMKKTNIHGMSIL